MMKSTCSVALAPVLLACCLAGCVSAYDVSNIKKELPAAKPTVYDPQTSFAVFGYLPEYRYGGFQYEAAFQTGLTHLIYFSLEIDVNTGLPSALDRLPSKAQAKQARTAADKVGGKIILSFGGNARSQGFPNMATSPDKRRKFLEALDAILVEYQFDGVDYNWEYPADDHEWQQWGHLMHESKDVLLGGDRAKNIVTFTMYLDPVHFDIVTHYKLLDHADFVHCMAYDQRGRHSTLDFAQQGIKRAKGQKFNLRKFVMGVPFYARHVKSGEPKTFGELVSHLPNNKISQYGDYYFNSQRMIAKKTKVFMSEGLGGVMIWELGQDVQPTSDRRSLMWAIKYAVDGTKVPRIKDKKKASSSGDDEL